MNLTADWINRGTTIMHTQILEEHESELNENCTLCRVFSE